MIKNASVQVDETNNLGRYCKRYIKVIHIQKHGCIQNNGMLY